MSGLADAFKGLKSAAPEAVLEAPAREATPAPRPKAAPERPSSASRGMAPGYSKTKPLAKSVDPEWEPAKIYLRKATKKKAWRRWEDEEGGDLSDLVQHLLEEYLRS